MYVYCATVHIIAHALMYSIHLFIPRIILTF